MNYESNSSHNSIKKNKIAECWWLTLIILATQEDCGNSSQDPILKKHVIKKGLVEWLKV
jgi:hypothetical protein